MASETCNIAQIKDEDVLRQMWQETNDFNKKKEIRAHMYKVREQRLKEFYTTDDVARDIQSSSTIDSKTAATHHADLLIDHSFQSLKSKEVRDSASPTKELVSLDRGWNVRETVGQSKDGKVHLQSRVATKSGSKELPGGVVNYAAKNEAEKSVYQDGDEHNFKRAVSNSNTSVLKQEAHGDGNTTFHATNTTSKTTSHYVNKQKITHPEQITVTKRVEGYVPNEVLRDPNTKVYAETNTLKDGTRLTTTRYEATGAQKKTFTARNEVSVNEDREMHMQSEDTVRNDYSSTPRNECITAKHIELDNTQKSECSISTHIERVQNLSHHRKTSEHCHSQNQHYENMETQERDTQRVSNETNSHKQITRDENVSRNVSQFANQTIMRNDTVKTIATLNNQQSLSKQQEFEPSNKQEKTTTVSTVATNSIDSVAGNVCIPVQHITANKIADRCDSIKEAKVEKVDRTSTYDSKRVSIDISPTHDAFARSLRSVTPERERRPSPEKKYRLSPDRKNSQHFASSDTITKVVLGTNKQPRVDTEPKQNGVKRSSISPSKKMDDKTCPNNSDKVLRRSDTYEERVRHILGIAEKKNQRPLKAVTDIITSDHVANRRPSLRDISRKFPTTKIYPRTSWLNCPLRKTAERKTPDHNTSLEKTLERINATATAKEIRKYYAGVGTCSPGLDLKDESLTSPDGDISGGTFTACKNGKIYTVSLIRTEKETSKKPSNLPRKSPEHKTSERRRQSSSTPPPLVHVSSDRLTPERSTPQSKPASPRPSPDRTFPEHSSLRKERNYALTYVSEESSKSVRATNDDQLYPSTIKHATLRDEHAEDELIQKMPKYLDGNGETIPECPAEFVRRTKPNHITIKKDLSHDVEKAHHDSSKSERDTTTLNITPGAKQIVPKKPRSDPKAAGTKITKPKTLPTDNPNKCISTKSIIINEAVAEQREIIVDLKRSKSSREDSPEKVWPVQTEEDSGIPRYPDQIQEPEDGHIKQTTNVKELVINENQDVDHFNRISELCVITDIADADRVTETDDCLLTVNEKVTKFQNVNQNKVTKGPAPKIIRAQFSVDEALAEDECLLSVSDKVNKFKTTVDQLETNTFVERPKSPRCQFNREGVATTVQRSVTAETAEVLPSTVNKVRLPKTPFKPYIPIESNKQSSKKFISSSADNFSTKDSAKTTYLVEMKKNTSYPDEPKSPETSKPRQCIEDDIATDAIPGTSKSSLPIVRKTLNFEEDSSMPGYMRQLDRSLRITSPHRESVMELEALSKGQVSHAMEEGVKTKFSVTLRGPDSGKKTITEVTSIDIEEGGRQKEIEDVFDLEILETMLATVINYELRRRIRLQIKFVKQMISEEKLVTPKAPTQPERKSVERATATTTTTTVNTGRRRPKNSWQHDRQRWNQIRAGFVPCHRSTERPSDQMPKDERPDWVKERPLRKASERTFPTSPASKSTVTNSYSHVGKDMRKDKSSAIKNSQDAVTSSYGIGPTDENGMPLFGLKALRTYKSDINTKVQEHMIISPIQSHSGRVPRGTTVANYCVDTKELQSQTTRGDFSPKKKSISDKKDEQPTVIRRNSVKEMTRKFVDNSIESSNAERKNTYKAGLILRTHSYKDYQSSSARGSSPEQARKAAGTFLTNTSKVSGVKDIITRMKTEDVVEGDSEQDTEARQLLNKFLGSQVILAGIEGGSSEYSRTDTRFSASPVAGKRTTKVTTTITERGIPKTSVRSITHPITQEHLQTIWDEHTLRVLLEQSTKYEERLIIRARLRDVMAEKEACSEFVGKEMEEKQSGNVHGESLLLPLLQNALEPPEFEQTADSGTESGEDLRSGLILEVQSALEKLSACLCSDSSDISQERRNSLLQLVSKLQMNLVAAPSQKASANAVAVAERSSGADSGETSTNNVPVAGGGSANGNANGSSNRCSRRQARLQSARLTVGVSSEELENARRLMEEFVRSSSQENVPALQKELQYAAKCVSPVRTPQAVQNSLPKPFVNHTQFSTPSEVSSPIAGDPLSPTSDHYNYKQSLSFEQPEAAPPRMVCTSHSLDAEPADALCAVILRPSDYHLAMPLVQANQLRDGDTVVLYDQSIYPPAEEITSIMQQPASLFVSAPSVVNEEPVVLQANPIYMNDKEKSNRFNTKKSRMKRANTIDIPKPSNYYIDEDSEGEHTEPETNSRKSNYLALRGSIRAGNTRGGSSAYKVPSFEPRTESDKKFLAFINQQNAKSDVSNKVSLWDKSNKKQAADDAGTNWTRKFGFIKTNFERVSENTNTYRPPDLQTGNVARSFWKTAENNQEKVGNVINAAAPNRRQKCEPNISPVAKSKPIAAQTKYNTPQPQILPQLMTPVNKFMHNPNESAFKPIHKTKQPDVISSIHTNYNEYGTPDVHQYTSSPIHNSAPWNTKGSQQPTFGGGERRVLSLAASKFEANNAITSGDNKIVPRKLSKDKIHMPPSLLQSCNKSEKLVAYVPPVTKAGCVRKLSGQYDSPKHTSAFAPVPQAPDVSMPHPHSNNSFDYQQARNQPPSNLQPIAEPIPPSFHTTSSQVQQMRHNNHLGFEHASEHISPVHEPPVSGSPQMAPHVYYNNVASHQHPYSGTQQYRRQTSNESVHEHLAVSSKVMSAPVSQQAVRVTNKPRSRDDHDIDAAFSLRNALQEKTNVKSPRIELTTRALEAPKFCVNNELFEPKSAQIQPPKRITQRVSPTFNKSDTWHQVGVPQQQPGTKPSPRASPNARTVIKSKSTHLLVVPKQFEAGMSKDEMNAKKRTMEGYFGRSAAQKFDRPVKDVQHRSVNRVKTSEKISTMTTTTTGKIETRMFGDNPMSEMQVITTRKPTAVQQQQVTRKPMTPFAKFRQMDRANSFNTPPSTPKTPTSCGGPMFKFTDPHLCQSASTIKERLLHWCQTKTREYDNIKLDNFSTCWADGLAFCALIHHFIPDAFDYNRLTPNNRRYNFTLAFQVADEKADIAPLLDVDDMVATRRPDWKCVFTYVQSIYRRFKDQD